MTRSGGRTLAYPLNEPEALAMRLARMWGYEPDVGSVVRMVDQQSALATASVAGDVDAVLRVGDLRQPSLGLLRDLAEHDGAVQMVSVAVAPSPWVWASARETAGLPVRVRVGAYNDVSPCLAQRGVQYELVEDAVPLEELLDGTEDGSRSVILDRDEVPDHLGWRGDLGDVPPITFGVATGAPGARGHYHWIVTTPHAERVGTLARALDVVAAHGVNLDFLHSDALDARRHRFFMGFESDGGLDPLAAALHEVGMRVTVLGSIEHLEQP
ncbi:hypothetical protein [Nocardioides sp. TF02-7]|uniref:hypothetical protein n=1 Tax=Nocardioides sp. TF02-7 TaxID=2917724 RepID=UPI001F06F9C9|nr:hypothetical protein [Nocardioides sp. TF02-7]UMG91755.1 hypothetical protein MF408_17045 [Nocardioides sp. TF02-7]